MAGTWYLIASSSFSGNPVNTSCGVAVKTFVNNSIVVNYKGYNKAWVDCLLVSMSNYLKIFYLFSGGPEVPLYNGVISKEPNGDEIYNITYPSNFMAI